MKEPLDTNEESLLERLRRAEAKAQEAILVAAVYREQIEQAVSLARRAAREKHPDFLYGALSGVELALDEKNIKDWAKSWSEAWSADISWLMRAITQMRIVKDAAEKLDPKVSPANTEIQRIIISAARSVLVQHLPSSVNLENTGNDESSK
jgi:K+-transporting ATPase c subunit